MTRIEVMLEAGKQAAPLALAVLVGTLALAVLMYYGWQLMVETIEAHRKAKYARQKRERIEFERLVDEVATIAARRSAYSASMARERACSGVGRKAS